MPFYFILRLLLKVVMMPRLSKVHDKDGKFFVEKSNPTPIQKISCIYLIKAEFETSTVKKCLKWISRVMGGHGDELLG